MPIVTAAAQSDGEDSYLSSGTSSYESDNDKKMRPVKVGKGEEEKIGGESLVDRQLMEMMDEFEDPSASTYAKFKTQHELDPEQVEKYAPPQPTLDDLDELVEFGTVINFIDDGSFQSIIIIKPHNPLLIYDLDNIIALPGDKQVVGFILDLVGHVTTPLYSVRLYPSFVEILKAKGVENLKNQVVDQQVSLVKKCLKVINADLPNIMKKKGCDASNIYDEEVPEHEQEYSDDEKEKAAKRARKNKLKRKGKMESEGSDEEDEEEGEIKAANSGH